MKRRKPDIINPDKTKETGFIPVKRIKPDISYDKVNPDLINKSGSNLYFEAIKHEFNVRGTKNHESKSRCRSTVVTPEKKNRGFLLNIYIFKPVGIYPASL